MSAMDQVKLRFYYSEKDVVGGYRLHFKKTLRLPLTLLISVLSLALGIFYLSLDQALRVGYLLIIMPTVLLGIVGFVLFLFPRFLYRRDSRYNELYTIFFNEDGITFYKEGGESNFDWPVYSRACEDKNRYILYFGRNSFTIIPKHVFPSAESERNFRMLLAQRSLLYNG